MSDELDLDSTETSQPVVRYSAKELFAQINVKLDALPALLEAKASQHDLDALELTVDDHGKRLQSIEDHGLSHMQTFRALAWAVGTSLGVVTALTGVGTLVYFIVTHGGH